MSTSGVAAFGRTRDVEVGARGVLADPVARTQRVQRLIPMKQRLIGRRCRPLLTRCCPGQRRPRSSQSSRSIFAGVEYRPLTAYCLD